MRPYGNWKGPTCRGSYALGTACKRCEKCAWEREKMSVNKEHPTAEVEAVALLPCPFCGSKPHHGLTKVKHCQLHGDPYQDYEIWCPKHCARAVSCNREQATSKWNTRSTLSTKDRELAAENERLREALEAEDAYWSASRVLAAAFARIRPQAQAAFDAAMERRNKARAALQGSAS